MSVETLSRHSLHDAISSTEELLEEARAGRMFILVDDEDRENEGDLIIPAQFATPQALAFMMRNARGLICLALTTAQVEKLELPMMAVANQQRHQTAFTVSIEGAGRHHQRESPRVTARAPSRWRSTRTARRTIWSRLATCFHWPRAAAARWSGRGTRKPRWTSHAWPG